MRTFALGFHLICATTSVWAQGFSAYVTPPRFELQVQPGETLRQVFEIQHVGVSKGQFRVHTNDWELRQDGSVTFFDELITDSCRPWVAIERRQLVIEPGAKYRYRFEVTPPPDTAPKECRFAIMVEGQDSTQGMIQARGRIGVIVYVSVGGAAADLVLQGHQVGMHRGTPAPTLRVHNQGQAHTRLEGYLDGVDAKGQRFELAPADQPILPGEVRNIALIPVVAEGQSAPAIQFPIQVKGQLDWGKKRLPVQLTFELK